MKKWIIIGLGILILVSILIWANFQSAKPLPGKSVSDLGRGHIEISKTIDYNSNPPTSGPHYPDWVKKGVYNTVKEDRYLVHSLEHGYIVMSYNCDFKPTSFVPSVNAQESSNSAVPTRDVYDATNSANLSQNFNSGYCQDLINRLKRVYEAKGTSKLIIVPRPSLDARVALTAWNKIDKFNEFDQDRISKFIDAFRNHGPEATMEQ